MEAQPTPVPTSLEALEARIQALESELVVARREIDRRNRQERTKDRGRGRRSEGRDMSDSTRDTADRAIDETNKLFRSMTMAYAEGLRSAADAVGEFSDELSRRSDDDDDNRERLASLPGDVYASYLKAINRALKIPERTVDRFQESYKREGEQDRSADRDDPDRPR